MKKTMCSHSPCDNDSAHATQQYQEELPGQDPVNNRQGLVAPAGGSHGERQESLLSPAPPAFPYMVIQC